MTIYNKNNLWYIATDGLLFCDEKLDFVLSIALQYMYSKVCVLELPVLPHKDNLLSKMGQYRADKQPPQRYNGLSI